MGKPSCKFCGKECKLAPSQRVRNRNPRTQCNSCCVTKRRWKSKIELIGLLGGKCERCGWIGHPAGFQFHHKDPSEKDFMLNGNGLLLKNRVQELSKCELLCACCHSIHHANTELIQKMGIL